MLTRPCSCRLQNTDGHVVNELAAVCTGTLQVPALLAVHESAPDDPSVPAQRAYPSPADPQPPRPSGKPTAQGGAGLGKLTPSSTPTKDDDMGSSPQNDSTQNMGPTIADAAAADGSGPVSSSSDAELGWGFKTAKLPGFRRAQQHVGTQTPKGKLAALASKQEEAGSREWPYLCYPLEQLQGWEGDNEFAEQQRWVVEEILQGTRQQGSGDQASANPDAQAASSGLGGDTFTEVGSQSEELEQTAEQQRLQEPAADVPHAEDQNLVDPVYLPKLDLLAQFGEVGASGGDSSDGRLADAKDADADALPDRPSAGTAPASSSEGPAVRMAVNLNGAQVLTPDGWQPVTSNIPIGTAWEQGNCLTIGMTLQYHLCATSGKITDVTCGWATVDAYAWSLEDMMEVYIRCTGLHEL